MDGYVYHDIFYITANNGLTPNQKEENYFKKI